MRAESSSHFRHIDFDREFRHGRKAYERVVGTWWHGRSDDAAHAHAYRQIARAARESCRRPRGTIVDYTCGSGNLLVRLVRQFPGAQFIGVDGSSLMLAAARERLGRRVGGTIPRVRLIQTELPDPTLPRGVADLVVYAFPNMLHPPGTQPWRDRNDGFRKDDLVIARHLADAREPDPEDEDEDEDPETRYEGLLETHAVARNIRRMLRKGGVCVRVEYSDAHRTQLTDLDQQRSAFEEGSLEGRFRGRRPRCYFRVVRSTYSRSGVIEDVYHQTGRQDDRVGGYMLSVLEAI